MQNVEPEHWGAHLWKFVHWSAAALPIGPLSDDLKQTTTSLVSLLCYLIPCETCRDHFIQFVHAVAPNFTTNEDVKSWWLKCHNFINRTLKKAEWGMDQLNQAYNLGTIAPPKSYPMVTYTQPHAASFGGTASTFDINAYMKGAAQPPAQKVLGFVHNGKWKPIQRTVPTTTRKVATFGNTGYARGTSSYQTNLWRSKLQQKTGAGTAAPPKKKGCKKCGRR